MLTPTDSCPVDEAAPIRQQQERFKFDVLIHKASDWIVHSTGHPKASLALPPLFESLASSALPWLDSVDATMPVLSRTEMHQLLLELARPEGGLSHRLVLPVTDSFTARTNLEARTPFIIKSNAACGVSFSHNMVGIFRAQARRKCVVRLTHLFPYVPISLSFLRSLSGAQTRSP